MLYWNNVGVRSWNHYVGDLLKHLNYLPSSSHCVFVADFTTIVSFLYLDIFTLNCINVAFFNHSFSCQFVALDVGAHVPAREIQLHPEAARKSSKYSGALSAEARPGG